MALQSTSSNASSPRPRTLTFYDLPGELRNKIYAEAARDSRISFRYNSPTFFTSALPFVSRQVRTESLCFIYSMAPICGRVDDWCFQGAISFEDRLTVDEMKAVQRNPHRFLYIYHKRNIWASKKSTKWLTKWLHRYPDLPLDTEHVCWSYLYVHMFVQEGLLSRKSTRKIQQSRRMLTTAIYDLSRSMGDKLHERELKRMIGDYMNWCSEEVARIHGVVPEEPENSQDHEAADGERKARKGVSKKKAAKAKKKKIKNDQKE